MTGYPLTEPKHNSQVKPAVGEEGKKGKYILYAVLLGGISLLIIKTGWGRFSKN